MVIVAPPLEGWGLLYRLITNYSPPYREGKGEGLLGRGCCWGYFALMIRLMAFSSDSVGSMML